MKQSYPRHFSPHVFDRAAMDDNQGDNIEPEDRVSLKALSDEDLAYIAKNPGYRAMLQDILSPIIGENSNKDTSADNTGPNSTEGSGTDNTRPIRKSGVPDQHSDDDSSEEESDDDAATAFLEKLSHALGKRKSKKTSGSARKKQGVTEGEEPLLFNPSLDRG